jgi:hypothetical protein
MYEVKPIKTTEDFSMETLNARRTWSAAFQALNENNFSPWKLLHSKTIRAVKIFHNKYKLKQCMVTKPPLQKIHKEFCTQKMKANKTMIRWEESNHRRIKDK